jgi:hypothetical protein
MKLLRMLAAIFLLATTAIAHPGSGIVIDRRGYVYFLDTGSGVWMIDPVGKLTRLDGPRFHWMAIDQGEQSGVRRLPSIAGGEITPVGPAPTLLLSSDVPIAIGRNGALYYPELGRSAGAPRLRTRREGVHVSVVAVALIKRRLMPAVADGQT